MYFRDVKRVLFVPYALHDRDAYTKLARDKFKTLGRFMYQIIFESHTVHLLVSFIFIKP